MHHIKLIWLLNWQHKLTASDNLGFRGLGVAMCIHLQTSKSSPAILWLSTRMRDSFALKNRTALFHALDNLCLLRQKWSLNHSLPIKENVYRYVGQRAALSMKVQGKQCTKSCIFLVRLIFSISSLNVWWLLHLNESIL